jgi:hypothetical protein
MSVATSSRIPNLPTFSRESSLATSTSQPKKASFIDAHHHLPDTLATFPTKPILFLPPLLSPLPPDHDDQHGTQTPTGPIADFDTRLPHIDPDSLALHRALHHFRPVDKYASTVYNEAFNWDELVRLGIPSVHSSNTFHDRLVGKN